MDKAKLTPFRHSIRKCGETAIRGFLTTNIAIKKAKNMSKNEIFEFLYNIPKAPPLPYVDSSSLKTNASFSLSPE